MKRREFFKNTGLAAFGASLLGPKELFAQPVHGRLWKDGAVKNIIFMVSDGMSLGTLTLSDLFKRQRDGRNTAWIDLYQQKKGSRALMDTASASSLVTDSAAASSAWGGGKRVSNGSLNVNPDGSFNKPILQKFKAQGKSVGCVTTVPITHATPAGFCVNSAKRSDMPGIALQYLDLNFDVMMGGGTEFFDGKLRQDKKDLFKAFTQSGYEVVKNREAMMALSADADKPLLGVFHEDGLPYALDRENDPELKQSIPTLKEMTRTAIAKLKRNPKGFVMQIEGGKVDWAAHANDAPALIYDQLDFDEAVAEALSFAEEDGQTLVMITTDHGNANPGLFYGDNANANLESLFNYKHTNDWILNGIRPSTSLREVQERIEFAQGWAASEEEAKGLLSHYQQKDEMGVYNPRKLPFRPMAVMAEKHTSIGWASMDHSGDYVELTAFGPGSDQLPSIVKNFELHEWMLERTGMV